MVFSMIYDDLGTPPMTSETTKCRTGPHLAKGRFGGAGFTADRAFGVAFGGGGALPLPLPRVEIREELQQEV